MPSVLIVEGLLIYNTETKQLEIYSDGAWKASSGGGDSLPKGTIAFFNLSACPSGWTEKTELKGRYPIGLPTSGTLGQSVGTALTNGENRSVGQHSHGVTDPGHSHGVNDPGHSHNSQKIIWAGGMVNLSCCGHYLNNGPDTTSTSQANISLNSSSANISIQNSGSVAGTNAPYVQLLACEKLTTATSSGTSTTSGSFWQNNGTSIYYNDGNVGVGTSTPAQKMEVAGNVKASGVCIGNDCKNAWPTTTSTDTLQTVTDRGATTTKNISPAGLCLSGDCRTSWPVKSWFEYYDTYVCGYYGSYHYLGYYVRTQAPNGGIYTLSNIIIQQEPYYCYYYDPNAPTFFGYM